MSVIKAVFQAMRLRTLPLSVSGVVLGVLLASSDFHLNPAVALFTVLTAVLLQILSNVANELGDTLNGTDTSSRQGPEYPLMNGALSVRDFKIMIMVYAACAVVSGIALLKVSFGTVFCLESVLFMILGAVAISGALKYTLGSSPYGYRGFGDLSVFIFFGLLSVLGSYFLVAHTIKTWLLLLPAVSIGTFSMAVLNVNNMRDMKTDAATRRTIPVRIGLHRAKIYHTVLVCLGWVAMTVYSLLRFFDWWHFLFFLTLPLFILHLVHVWKYSDRELDKTLPLLSLSTLLFAVLGGLGYIIFLLQ